MVLLQHDSLDAGGHYDWMFERDSNDERRLVTFRVDRRVELRDAGEIDTAVRLGDHRAHYLEFQGEIPGGLGRVTRVASGVVREMDVDGNRLRAVVNWDTPGQEHLVRVLGNGDRNGDWRLSWGRWDDP